MTSGDAETDYQVKSGEVAAASEPILPTEIQFSSTIGFSFFRKIRSYIAINDFKSIGPSLFALPISEVLGVEVGNEVIRKTAGIISAGDTVYPNEYKNGDTIRAISELIDCVKAESAIPVMSYEDHAKLVEEGRAPIIQLKRVISQILSRRQEDPLQPVRVTHSNHMEEIPPEGAIYLFTSESTINDTNKPAILTLLDRGSEQFRSLINNSNYYFISIR